MSACRNKTKVLGSLTALIRSGLDQTNDPCKVKFFAALTNFSGIEELRSFVGFRFCALALVKLVIASRTKS